MSALPPKADMCGALAAHVCFGPIADISTYFQQDITNVIFLSHTAGYSQSCSEVRRLTVWRICLTFALFAWLSASATAQIAGAISACTEDLSKFCNAGESRGNRLAECSNAHFQEFSEPCKTGLVKLAGVLNVCRADIRKQCPGIKLGAGRLLLCVKKHFSNLSEPCKSAVGSAAAKRMHIRSQ
jgi:hypothetical protein